MVHVLANTFLLLVAIAGMTNIILARGEELPIRITSARADDHANVSVEEGRTIVSMQSPFGISRARLERNGNHWPKIVTLRLHLTGLEHFSVTNGQTTLHVAVASQATSSQATSSQAASSQATPQSVRLWLGDQEDLPLKRKNPYWMTVRRIGQDGKPVKTLPWADGYFEMQLPKALLDDHAKSITLNWIDFYR
jgi:hypothetical protein